MKKKKEFIEINQEKLYRSVENYNYIMIYTAIFKSSVGLLK